MIPPPPPTAVALIQAINQYRTNNLCRMGFTLMNGGLHHLVFSPPPGTPTLILHRKGSRGVSRLGGDRPDGTRMGGGRLGKGKSVPRTRVGGRLGLLDCRRTRQPLGRTL